MKDNLTCCCCVLYYFSCFQLTGVFRTGTDLYGSFLSNNFSTKFVTGQRFFSRARVGHGNQKIKGIQRTYWSGDSVSGNRARVTENHDRFISLCKGNTQALRSCTSKCGRGTPVSACRKSMTSRIRGKTGPHPQRRVAMTSRYSPPVMVKIPPRLTPFSE